MSEVLTGRVNIMGGGFSRIFYINDVKQMINDVKQVRYAFDRVDAWGEAAHMGGGRHMWEYVYELLWEFGT